MRAWCSFSVAMRMRWMSLYASAACAFSLALALVSPARADQLPIAAWSVADGLAGDHVTRVVVDLQGFVWICTTEGLSRFDGDEFLTVGAEPGAGGVPEGALRGAGIYNIAEDPAGDYWIASERGLFRYETHRPGGSEKALVPVPIEGIADEDWPTGILRDSRGRMWVGTRRMLHRFESVEGAWLDRRIEAYEDAIGHGTVSIMAMLEAESGVLVGTKGSGIVRVIEPEDSGRDGGVMSARRFSILGLPTHSDWIRDFLPNPAGPDRPREPPGPAASFWASTTGGVVRLRLPPQDVAGDAVLEQVLTHADGLPTSSCGQMARRTGDSILLATEGGLSELKRNADSGSWHVARSYTVRDGLSGNSVSSSTLDAYGNIWVGGNTNGLMRISSGGVTRFDELKLPEGRLADLIDDRAGNICVLFWVGDAGMRLSCGGNDGFRSVEIRLPPQLAYFGWGAGRKILQARDGSWWLATGGGVFHWRSGPFEVLGRRAADEHFGITAGAVARDVFCLFEDSRGGIWASGAQTDPTLSTVSLFSPAQRRFVPFTRAELPSGDLGASFAEDGAGNVWIGFYFGKAARYRDGHFDIIDERNGLSLDSVLDLFLDSRGRLWAGGNGILACDTPDAPDLASIVFRPDPAGTGVAGDSVECFTEDSAGRLYFGTGRGLMRIDRATGESRRFTIRDGLPGNSIGLCRRAADGGLWLSELVGLSRLEPAVEAPLPPPDIRIVRLSVGGDPRPVAPLGERFPVRADLDSDSSPVVIEFTSVGRPAGATMRYQVKLEGADAGWGALSSERKVQYAHLAPGDYHFLVRAVNEAGAASDPPAAVDLFVPAPVWQRWWFLALAALAAGSAGWALLRVRERRLIELERVRTRIATDLHDDIGSSLSQISILSQVAQRQSAAGSPDARGSLERITELSGELVDSIGDVVWSINPARDRLSDLVRRMRRFATELFSSETGVALTISLPEVAEGDPMDADLRRQIYRLFKEALHNIVKHARPRRVEVSFERRHDGYRLRIADDGVGFDPERAAGGHGLASMRARAEAVGGALRIRSTPERGTEIILTTGLAPGGRKLSPETVAGDGPLA